MTACAEPPVKERPILMSAAMVLAILERRKTQTRRLVKPQPPVIAKFNHSGGRLFHVEKWPKAEREFSNFGRVEDVLCPYGKPGDRLWVRETHGFWCHSVESVGVEYAAGGEDKIVDFPNRAGMPSLEVQCRKNIGGGRRKRPSIFMPRWASRITLEITGERVERLQEISEADAKAEGVVASETVEMKDGSPCYTLPYQTLWNQINGCDAWEKNPLVWVVEFKDISERAVAA